MPCLVWAWMSVFFSFRTICSPLFCFLGRGQFFWATLAQQRVVLVFLSTVRRAVLIYNHVHYHDHYRYHDNSFSLHLNNIIFILFPSQTVFFYSPFQCANTHFLWRSGIVRGFIVVIFESSRLIWELGSTKSGFLRWGVVGGSGHGRLCCHRKFFWIRTQELIISN